jgi:DNA-binding NarL/FixJ family response regulator
MSDEILVADDDPDSCRAIAEALNRAGYATVEAANGDEALAIAEQSRPAFVITEVLLEGASGYELCHAVKEWYGPTVPVILVSYRRTEPADRVAGLLIGADDYVPKPLLPADVMGLMTEGLSQVEIANCLVITPRTVAKHVEHILRKLRVHSRAQAVALALRSGHVGPGLGGAHHPPAASGG